MITDLPEEPCDEVAKDDGLVGLVVIVGRRNGGNVPQIGLPLVHVTVCRLCVEEEDSGCALDQPAPIQDSDAAVFHGLDGRSKLGVGGLHGLDLDGRLKTSLACEATLRDRIGPQRVREGDTYGLVVEGPNEGVTLAIFGRGYWGLGLDDRVDAAD
jgi:hypothetical protein